MQLENYRNFNKHFSNLDWFIQDQSWTCGCVCLCRELETLPQDLRTRNDSEKAGKKFPEECLQVLILQNLFAIT